MFWKGIVIAECTGSSTETGASMQYLNLGRKYLSLALIYPPRSIIGEDKVPCNDYDIPS